MITHKTRKNLRRELLNNRKDDSIKQNLPNSGSESQYSADSSPRITAALSASVKNFLDCFREYPYIADFKVDLNPSRLIKFKLTSPEAQQFIQHLNTSPIANNPKIWLRLFQLRFPEKFDNYTKEYGLFLINKLLKGDEFGPLDKLFFVNHFVIAPFWYNIEGLSMEKVNAMLFILKKLVGKYIKIAIYYNSKDIRNFARVHYKMIENLKLEFSTLLLSLFEVIKKKSNCLYSFILITEMIQKLQANNLISGLEKINLSRLSIKLNHAQRETFTELFYTKNEKTSDRNEVLKSPILAELRDQLNQAVTVFETRNSCAFSEIWQAYEVFLEGLEYLKQKKSSVFPRLIEFKVLLQMSTEIIEYFCSKPTNNNTSNLYDLDEYTLRLKPFVEYMTTKRRSVLKGVYLKANLNFDKEPNKNVLRLLELKAISQLEQKKEIMQSKPQKVSYNADILVDIKFVNKLQEPIERFRFIQSIEERIIQEKLWARDVRIVKKFTKMVFKVMKANAVLSSEVVKIFEEVLIRALENIPLATKSLFTLKSYFELFSAQNAATIKEHKTIFKLIEKKLDEIVKGEIKGLGKAIQKFNFPELQIGMVSPLQSGASEKKITLQDSRAFLESYNRICVLQEDDLFENPQQCTKLYEDFCFVLNNIDALNEFSSKVALKMSLEDFIERLGDISLALARNILYCFSKSRSEKDFFCTMTPLLKKIAQRYDLDEEIHSFTFYYDFEWRLVTSSVFRLKKAYGGKVLMYKSPYVERPTGEKEISKQLILSYQERSFTLQEIEDYFDLELKLFEESQDGLNHFRKDIFDNFDKFRFFEPFSHQEPCNRRYIIFAHHEKYKPKRNVVFYYTFCNLKFLTF